MKIVAVRKNQDGNITDFKLDNGQELNYQQAVDLARKGQIENIDMYNRYGRVIIRSEADGDISNNLDNLPTF